MPWCQGAASRDGAVEELTTLFIATGHPNRVLLPPEVAHLKGRLHHIMKGHDLIKEPIPLQLPFPGSKAKQLHVEPLPVRASGAISTNQTIRIQTYLKEHAVGKLVGKIQIILKKAQQDLIFLLELNKYLVVPELLSSMQCKKLCWSTNTYGENSSYKMPDV